MTVTKMGDLKCLKKRKMPRLYRSDDLSFQERSMPPCSLKLSKNNMLDRPFAIAPMMEWTDRAEKQSFIGT
jgi:hypothetical protein